MYDDLKEKDKRVLDYIKDHVGDKGYPPSVREICRGLEIKSTSTAFSILSKLEKKGYIRKDPTKPRAIEILDKDRGKISAGLLGMNSEIINLPVVGSISAGLPVLADENIEEYIPLPESMVKGENCFMLKVKGDSMIEAGIFENDFIIVDSANRTPQKGKIVVALINGESATVKTLKTMDSSIVILKPENQNYDLMIYPIDQVEIIGQVTGLLRSF